jgi:hypothetical protein
MAAANSIILAGLVLFELVVFVVPRSEDKFNFNIEAMHRFLIRVKVA